MVFHHGRFAWYELLTTDVAAARTFYADVMGWDAQDASTPDLRYTLFTATSVPVSGLMELPEQARKMGATPRWIGYVAVDDVDAVAERIKHLGGAVYVPPTDSNIGRVSIVADPQTSTFAFIEGLQPELRQSAGPGKPGHVGWHELLAADRERAVAFYVELFGWRRAAAETGPVDTYQSFSAGGQIIGGIITKRPMEPVPYWLYYFNTGDIDAAAERVKRSGGQIFEGPLELADGSLVVRCSDPQGTYFALQGKRNEDGIGWSTEWDGISSRGRMVIAKPGR